MNDRKFPVLLTFELDGEALWLARDNANAKKPIQLSQGTYGPKEGLPRILDILNRYHVKSTFFIPGMIAEKYPECIRAIHEAGHEIGNHTWSHRDPQKYESYDEEYKEIIDTNNILGKLTGKKPVGYRSPAAEFGPYTLDVLEKVGFEYESNMMHTNSIHKLKVFEHQTDIVDIPIGWQLDDSAYWLYSITTPGRAMQPLRDVEHHWAREFDALYREFTDDVAEDSKDLALCIIMHPQIIGVPTRSTVLTNVIDYISGFPGAQFMTCAEASNRYLSETK